MNSRTSARAWAATFAGRAATALGALLIFAALSLPALAQDGARSAALSKESTEAFSAYIQETTQSHRRPDYSKPPVAQYLQQILDTDAFAALPPVQGSDIP
jgi:ABC-type transporter MlaC component